KKSPAESPVNLAFDGYFFEPKKYIKKLQEIESQYGIKGDFYSQGGVVKELEQKFCEISGKEAAIYMPSGTMANELSIRILCGDKTKAIVHDQSHIYRDEGDSAQAIHNKRLVPIITEKHYYSLNDLTSKIESLEEGEVFYSGVGAISVENPVRRHYGKIVGIEHIKNISDYAHESKIKTHLDGARLHLASAYSGISVKEYASYFDTVYISLYKYLGAAGGAILCGDHNTIDQMNHFIKILGGTTFRSWTHAAMANHFLDGLDDRMAEMIEQSEDLITKLKELGELQLKTIPNGTNVIFLRSEKINLEKFADEMNNKHGIWMKYPANREIEIHFNESMLQGTNSELLAAFKSSIEYAR
ncbi:MAG: threonine aldolase family protein, partial [Anaerolineales bacterium]|nr:threonine aldolase family protein [Anaerolineales bacterium]